MPTNKIYKILRDIKEGRPVIIVDSMNRENEGDVMIAAEKATEETLAFFAREARGIMCIPTTKIILDRLEIPMSPSNNTDKFSTPFTVSVDARYDISTGVSVGDRLKTVNIFTDDNSIPDQITYPGHLFPLRCKDNLLKERQGHTEASVQLCLLAEFKPIAIISEIMNYNGTMSRLTDLEYFATHWCLNIISIEEIIEFTK